MNFLKNIKISSIFRLLIGILFGSNFGPFFGLEKLFTNEICDSEHHRTYGLNEKSPILKCSKLEQTLSSPNYTDKMFLYVGVLSAGMFVDSRVNVINNTWRKTIPGCLQFVLGKDAQNQTGNADLPFLYLNKVNDTSYPPQKKSLMLLKSMYNYLNFGYDWFMRADDDVYVRGIKLMKFLTKLNSSRPIVIGQAGFGNKKERGKLHLENDDNYCMGGPGMIFSKEAIRLVGPHLHKCLQEMYTWHEDVEVSRCLRRFAGVNCVYSYEATQLFHEYYEVRRGFIDPFDERYNSELPKVITLHPNKKEAYHYSVHHFYLKQTIMEKIEFIKKASIEIKKISELNDFSIESEIDNAAFKPSSHIFVDCCLLLGWNFYKNESSYDLSSLKWNQTLSVVEDIQPFIKNIITKLNIQSSKSKYTLHEVNHVYRRVLSPFAVEYKLDLVFNRVNKASKKSFYRQIYSVQQNFIHALIHERSLLSRDKLSVR